MKKIGIAIIIILVSLLVINNNNFNVHGSFDEDGYIMDSEVMIKNLTKENLDFKDTILTPTYIQAYNEIYKKSSNYYVGENKKTKINLDYPTYSVDGTLITMMSNTGKLIDQQFVENENIEGLIVSDGKGYYGDSHQRIDFNEYLLLKIKSQYYINLKPIQLKTATDIYEIPMNSLVYLGQDFFRYYTFEDGQFKYRQVKGIDLNTEVTIFNQSMVYETFLTKLNEYKINVQESNEEKEEIKDDQNKANNPSLDSSNNIEKPPTVPNPSFPEFNGFPDDDTISGEIGEGDYSGGGWTGEVPYTKPAIRFTYQNATVYTFNGKLQIYDPAAVIVKAPTFYFKNNDMLYLRSSFNSSGQMTVNYLKPSTQYEVYGEYSYLNEAGTEITEIFYTDSFSTLSLDSLSAIDLAFEAGQVFSDRIQLENLHINSELNNEALLNIKKLSFVAGGIEYNLSSANLKKLKNGDNILYSTPTSLMSNTNYDFYFKAIDRFGNELLLTNKSGQARTCKLPPTASIKATINRVANVELKISLTNRDQLTLYNYRAIITDSLGNIVEDELVPTDGIIKLSNLNSSKVYTVTIYADYNIEDGTGLKVNQVIGVGNITTSSLSTLGSYYLSIDTPIIKANTSQISVKLNISQTDPILISLLHSIEIEIYQKQPGKKDLLYLQTKALSIEEVKQLKDNQTLLLDIYDLPTSSDIVLKAKSIVMQGNESYDGVVSVKLSKTEFKTMKAPAKVYIKDEFVTSKSIEFEIMVEDNPNYVQVDSMGNIKNENAAILRNQAIVQIRDEDGNLIYGNTIKTNQDYQTISINKNIVVNSNYTISVMASDYNEGYDNSTFESNKTIFKKEIQATEGISGELALQELKYDDNKRDYNASVQVTFNDVRSEVSTNQFKVERYVVTKGIENKVDEFFYTLNKDHQYNEINKYLSHPNVEYCFKLLVEVRGKWHVIDTMSFNTEEEIYGIKTSQELFDVSKNPTKKYIVLNDIDYTSANQPLGDFSGKIDFQGHKITLNTTNSVYRLASYIRSGAEVRNLNLYVDTSKRTSRLSYTGFISYYNYGLVDNLYIEYHNESPNKIDNFYWGLGCETNFGTFSNFIINYVDAVTTERQFGSIAYSNVGTVENGYVYGKNIDASLLNSSTGVNTKIVGGIIGNNSGKGRMSNLYSLINIDTNLETSTDNETVANIVGANSSIVENTFSVGSSNNGKTTFGPSIGKTSAGTVNNNFYIADSVYTTSGNSATSLIPNLKVAKRALYEIDFYKAVINAKGNFLVDEYIPYGAYPQLKMNDCMPDQTWLSLPDVTLEPEMDIVSSEVIENTGETGKIKFTISNPGAYTITSIQMNGVTTRIETQTNDANKSIIVASVEQPERYLSNYSVNYFNYKLSYGSGKIGTVSYVQNERLVLLELYRPINNMNDWKLMNTRPTENFRLKTDLNFELENRSDICVTPAFYGKFDGANHTIKNINVGNNGAIFYDVRSSFSNLIVDNFSCTSTVSEAGVIRRLQNTANIDNVHVLNSHIQGRTYVGALVGFSYADITNCSVNNTVITNEYAAGAYANIGGLVGYFENRTIANCYVQNIDIRVHSAFLIEGVGGIVGRTNSAKIDSVYATGKILNNSHITGGIVGRLMSNSTVSNVYSDVLISVSGRDCGSTIGYIYGNNNILTGGFLSVGDFYNRQDDEETTHRNIGDFGNFAQVNNSANIYFYNQQKRNGISGVNDTNLNELNDGKIVSVNDLSNSSFYDQYFGESYDVGDPLINQGILPKLFYSNSNQLLPFQEENKLYKNSISIEDISTSILDANANRALIIITLDRDSAIEITGVDVSYLNIENITIVNSQENGKSQVRLTVTPKDYYDSYPITGVRYKDSSGKQQTYSILSKVNLSFYKNIYTVADWMSIDENSYGNYRLMNDIDFSGLSNVLGNINIGSLVSQEGKQYALKNINLTLTTSVGGLLNDVSGIVKDVSFENITINGTYNNGQRLGLISILNGQMMNCTFSNITVNSKHSRTGLIGQLTGSASSLKLTNITILDTTSTAHSYYGGIVGASTVLADINDIELNNVEVNGNGSYVGGVIGSSEGTINDILVTNPKIHGLSYVGGVGGNLTNMAHADLSVRGTDQSFVEGDTERIGGIAGNSSTASNRIHVSNLLIKGTTYVGGLYGVRGSSVLTTSSISESIIEAKTSPNSAYSPSYIGGIVGNNTHNIFDATVINTLVNSTPDSVQAFYVGGVAGYSSSAIRDAIVDNSMISNEKDTFSGGIVGKQSSGWVQRGVVQNSTINGDRNVGGIIGSMINDAFFFYGYTSNTTVIAKTTNAGGILGLWERPTTLTQSTNAGIRQAFVNGLVQSNGYAGGIIGYIEESVSGNGVLLNAASSNTRLLSMTNVEGNNKATMSVGNSSELTSTVSQLFSFTDYTVNSIQYNPSLHGGQIPPSNIFNTATFFTNSSYLGIDINNVWGWGNSDTVTNNYSNNDGYLPFLRSETWSKKKLVGSIYDGTKVDQIGLQMPTITNKLARNVSVLPHELPKVNVYTNDVDKINLEFTKVDKWSTFSILVDNNVIIEEAIEQRVYTLQYDFKTNFTIRLTDGINEELIECSPNMFVRYAMTYENHDGYIINQILTYDKEILEGQYIHLYKNKAISIEGDMIDLTTKQTLGKVEGITLLKEIQPLYEFNYEEGIIQTFGLFSQVGEFQREMQMYVYKSKLSLVDSKGDFVKDSILIDQYNNSDYLLVLGNDKKLHSLKDEITFPDGFVNENITYMTSNLTCDNGHVYIVYSNGNIVGFNYRTGEYLLQEKGQQEPSLARFFRTTIDQLFNLSQPEETLNKRYEEAKTLVEELTKNPVKVDKIEASVQEIDSSTEIAQSQNEDNDTTNSQLNKIGAMPTGNERYAIIYDTVEQTYQVFNETNLFDAKQNKNIVSENQKIESTNNLLSFYSLPAKGIMNTNKLNGVVLLLGASFMVVCGLGYIYHRKKK